MAIVYIEASPKGRQEGTAINGYVVEDTQTIFLRHSKPRKKRSLGRRGTDIRHVARVRHLNDKKRPDHWRAV